MNDFVVQTKTLETALHVAEPAGAACPHAVVMTQ